MKMLLFTSMPVDTSVPGCFRISEKFLEGVRAYQKGWPGEIGVIADNSLDTSQYMDGITVKEGDLPFMLHLLAFDSDQTAQLVEKANLVVSALEYNLLHLVDWCRKVPLIYISEYTHKTRKQIMEATTPNLIVKWRRLWWLYQFEKRCRRAVQMADGLQCNGMPTYDSYGPLNPNPLLFFDSRVTSELLATPREQNESLRLVYSGRLIKMKGVDHLIPFAIELRRLGIEFELDICGEGDLLPFLQQQIERYALSPQVRLKGKLDFTQELLPLMKNRDLFICPHIQGDPSCTYLETMACGVPIAGYNNEAFLGLSQCARVGWPTPLGNPKLLALKVAQLSCQRDKLREASSASLHFAAQHTFEKTFQRRLDHFFKVLGNASLKAP